MLLALTGAAGAAPEHPLLTQPAVAPVGSEAVRWIPAPPVPEAVDGSNEDQLVRHLEAHPERLSAEAMGTPDLVRASTELLLRSGRIFLAERLLAQGVEKWPEDAVLRRAWARVLISLWRLDAARTQLEKVVAALPEDASTHYLLARTWLGKEPRTADTDARAAAALRVVLRLAPAYQDPDGVTAEVIRDLLKRLPASP